MRFSGIYAPLATPFDHRGGIFWAKFDFNLSQLRRTNLAGFVVGGRWGEGPLLSAAEKSKLWERAVAQADGGAQVLAAISGCGVAETRDLVANAARAGCAAAVIEAPDTSVLAPGSETSDLFFRAVADSATIPVLMDAPTCLGGEAPRLSGLAAHPGIAGAVLPGRGADLVKYVAGSCGSGFAILIRDLEGLVGCFEAGASAAVLAVASAVPFHALSIEEAVRTRERAAAVGLIARASAFEQLLTEHGVAALKQALDLRSAYGGPLRLPLQSASQETAAAISAALHELVS